MIKKNVEAVCEGRCSFGKITVSEGTPHIDRFVCDKGDRLYDRLFYIDKGTFIICEPGKKEIRAGEGMVVYLPADVAYESLWVNPPECHFISLQFVATDLECRPLPFFDGLYLIKDDTTRSIYRLMREMLETYVRKEKFSELTLYSILNRIIFLCFRSAEKSTLKKDGTTSDIYKAILYLNDNYMSDVTTEELAQMCLMSPASFRRTFKKYNDCSPMQYKMKLKMSHAKEMLESGVYTVFEVSELMNCTDMSHFNRLYKAEFGINPSESLPTYK